MLLLEIPERELFIEQTSELITLKSETIQLEHSLVSLSKWESKWKKPYLSSEKTEEEVIDYIRCMTITQNVKPETYLYLPLEVSNQVANYIEDKMTATWITEEPRGGSRQIVTAELIYYWMIMHNIPMECQKWHLNRLIMLIRVCNAENKPKTKRTRQERQDALYRRSEENRKRREKYNTKG